MRRAPSRVLSGRLTSTAADIIGAADVLPSSWGSLLDRHAEDDRPSLRGAAAMPLLR